MNRGKVLTIYYRNEKGGRSKRLMMMIEVLLEQGFEVHYISANKLKIEKHENLHPHIVRVPVRYLSGLWFWLWFSLLAPFIALKIVGLERFRVIAVYGTVYSILAFPASLLTRTPTFLFVRSIWWARRHENDWFLSKLFFRFRNLLGLIFAKRIVVSSKAAKRELVNRFSWLKSRVLVLPNSLILPKEVVEDEKKFLSWKNARAQKKRALQKQFELSEKSAVFVTVGALTKVRNIDYLVRASGAANSEKFSLVICGDGPERERVLSLIVGHGIGQRTVFTGWVEEPETIVGGTDLFILPAIYDGMSNAMLEALGSGTPVIAAENEELREILRYDDLLFSISERRCLSGSS